MISINNNRFSRQTVLNHFGKSGQKKIEKSSVFVIGTGGLGSPVLIYLTLAGVGKIAFADNDIVSISNLQRQILFSEEDLNRKKTDVVFEKLSSLNSTTVFEKYSLYVDKPFALTSFSNFDLILDCTDSFESKFMINDVCVEKNIPYIHAGVVGWRGQIKTIIPHKNACLRCIFDENDSELIKGNNAVEGILGSVASLGASIQVSEALKLLSGNFDNLLTEEMLFFNAFSMDFQKIVVEGDDKCPVCYG